MNDTDFTADPLDNGRRLFAGESTFIMGAVQLEQIPPSDIPEIAFAGRSNVGKSSLLNALTGRKNLARTSNTPGRTREINFFNLEDRLMLADLPGYGYARAPKTMVDGWTRLINDYLRGRAELRRCFLLIDARHGLKESDRAAMAMMDAAAQSYQIVLTKCDKIKPGPYRVLHDKILAELAKHPAAYPSIVATSARKGDGLEALRAELAQIALPK